MAVSKFRKRIRKLLSCFPVLEKCEIRHFHVLVVVQRQLRNVEKIMCKGIVLPIQTSLLFAVLIAVFVIIAEAP